MLTPEQRHQKELNDAAIVAIAELRDAIKNLENAVTANTSSTNQHNLPWPQIPLNVITQRSDSESSQDQANTNAQRSFEHRSLAVQWCLFVATLLAFCAAIYYAVIADRQKDTMDQTLQAIFTQTKATQGQLAEMKGASVQTGQLIASSQTSADAAKSAADTAAKSLEVSNRAWITVSINIEGGLHFTEPYKGRIKIGRIVNNIGHSAATNVEAVMTVVPMQYTELDFMRPSREQKRMCKEAEHLAGPNAVAASSVIYPNTPDIRPPGNVFSGIDLKQTSGFLPGMSDDFSVYIVGCVYYRYATSRNPHYSGFVYQLISPEGSIFTAGTDIKELTAQRFELGGGWFAN